MNQKSPGGYGCFGAELRKSVLQRRGPGTLVPIGRVDISLPVKGCLFWFDNTVK